MEQTQCNMAVRWFIGLVMNDAIWPPIVFSKTSVCLIVHDPVNELFNQVPGMVVTSKVRAAAMKPTCPRPTQKRGYNAQAK